MSKHIIIMLHRVSRQKTIDFPPNISTSITCFLFTHLNYSCSHYAFKCLNDGIVTWGPHCVSTVYCICLFCYLIICCFAASPCQPVVLEEWMLFVLLSYLMPLLLYL